jgi:hypothetical protein
MYGNPWKFLKSWNGNQTIFLEKPVDTCGCRTGGAVGLTKLFVQLSRPSEKFRTSIFTYSLKKYNWNMKNEILSLISNGLKHGLKLQEKNMGLEWEYFKTKGSEYLALERDKIAEGWRKLHNDELRNSCSSPNIRLISSRRMGWAGTVVAMEVKG